MYFRPERDKSSTAIWSRRTLINRLTHTPLVSGMCLGCFQSNIEAVMGSYGVSTCPKRQKKLFRALSSPRQPELSFSGQSPAGLERTLYSLRMEKHVDPPVNSTCHATMTCPKRHVSQSRRLLSKYLVYLKCNLVRNLQFCRARRWFKGLLACPGAVVLVAQQGEIECYDFEPVSNVSFTPSTHCLTHLGRSFVHHFRFESHGTAGRR